MAESFTCFADLGVPRDLILHILKLAPSFCTCVQLQHCRHCCWSRSHAELAGLQILNFRKADTLQACQYSRLALVMVNTSKRKVL